MSAIANFKKRREAEKANHVHQETAANTQAPKNEALTLLAELLGCEQAVAITEAKIMIGRGAYIAALTEEQLKAVEEQAEDDETIVGVDLASGEDMTVAAEVTTDEDGNIDTITELQVTADTVAIAADNANEATSTVTDATEKLESATSDLSDTSSDLAYNADDIASATADLKEATEELKKPSAAPKSSPGAKKGKAKKSSKK